MFNNQIKGVLRKMQSSNCRIAVKIQKRSEKVAIIDHLYEEKFRCNKQKSRPNPINGWLLWIKDRTDEEITLVSLPLKLKPEQNVWKIRKGRKISKQRT